MMRVLSLLLFLSVLGLSTVQAQFQAIIGAGSIQTTTNSTATTDAGPVYIFGGTSTNVHGKYHYLYTQAELAAAGLLPGHLVTKVSWHKFNNTTLSSTSPILFDIYLKNTNDTFPPAPQDFNTLIAGATQVYTSSSQAFTADTGWVEFLVATPFIYTGGNLAVTTAWNLSAAGQGAASGAFGWSKDNANTLNQLGTSASNTLNNLRTVRARIRFTHQPNSPCVSPPTPGTATTSAATVCAGQNFTLSLQGTSFGSGQSYQWQSSPDSLTWTNLTGDTNVVANRTQSVSVQYYRCLITCGANTVASAGVRVDAQVIPLGGTYTVNPALPVSSSNFQQLNAVLQIANCAGINAPVVLQMSPGTYTGNFTIGNFQGSSFGLTITSTTSNAADVIFTNGGTGNTFNVSGGNSITFSNITVSNPSNPTAATACINVTNSNSVSIVNCIVNANATSTSANNRAVYITGSNNIIVQGCTFSQAYYGIYHLGVASPGYSTGCSYIGNTFTNLYYYGIYITNHEGPSIISNTISDFQTNTSAHGMFLSRVREINVSNNIIRGSMGIYGIYLANTNLSPNAGTRNLVANNAVSGTFSSATPRAFYVAATTTDTLDEISLVHNSFWVRSTTNSTGSGGSIFFTGGTVAAPALDSITILNNSFEAERTGTVSNYGVLYFSNAYMKDILNSDNNNFFYSGATPAGVVRIDGTNYADLAAWRTFSNRDLVSISADPLYTSISNLSPLGISPLKDVGQVVSYVSTDINGGPRDATPDMGAYEIQAVANDILAIEIITPAPVVTGGTPLTVSYRFKNAGSSTLTSASMSYRFDNNAVVTESFTGNVPSQDTAIFTFTAPLNVPVGVSGLLTVWSSNPNGGNDATLSNDTLTRVLCQPLAGGTYTVGGVGANFNDLVTVGTVLSCGGVSGPVVFQLNDPSNLYTGQLKLENVPGTSASNTITFLGGGDTLRNGATPTPHTIVLDGAKFISFRNVVVQNTAAAGSGILMNNAENITLVGNTILLDTASTNTTNSGIVASGSTVNSTTETVIQQIRIDSNLIVGGYYGIRLNGAAASPAANVLVRDNDIRDFYVYGLWTQGTDGAIIEANDITRDRRFTLSSYYGIYSGSGTKGIKVRNNHIHSSNGTAGSSTSYAVYGMYFTGAVADSLNPNLAYNNLFYDLGSLSGSIYGVYLTGSSFTKLYHNTLVFDDTTSTAGLVYATYFLGTGTNNELKNNIIHVKRGGTGAKYCIYVSGTSNIPASDYNVLNMLSTGGTANHIGFFSSAQTTLTAWRAVNNGSFDQNSIDIDAAFVNPALDNYEPTNFAVNNLGTNLTSEVPTDLRGVARTTTPDPGVYEFNVAGCLGVQNLALDSVSHSIARVDWLSAATNWQIEYGVAGFTLGTGTRVTSASNPYTITGLSPNTLYDVYVRDTCTGTVSPWSTVLSFRTLRDFDLDIQQFIAPEASICADSAVEVRVLVRNKGTLPVVGYGVTVTASGVSTGSVSSNRTTTIAPNTIDTVLVGTLTLVNSGIVQFEARVAGTQDVYNDNDTLRKSSEVVAVPNPIIYALNDTVCSGDAVTLWLDTAIQIEQLTWFDSANNVLGTGDTLLIPALNTTTTYFAKGLGSVNAQVGPIDSTFGSAASFAAVSLSVQSMLITATVPVKFTRAKVYVQNTGWLVVMLRDLSGNEVARDSVFVTQNGAAYAPVYVDVDLDIPVGDWRLGALTNQTAGGMLRNSTGAAYPYAIPNVFSITGSTFGAAYYYYYYDMTITQPGCETDVAQVTVHAQSPSVASFVVNPTGGGTVSVNASASQNATTYRWNFGDGNTSLGQSVTHVYQNNGTYTITLIVEGGCRPDTLTQQVTIGGVSVEDLKAAMQLNLYPNPSSGEFTLKFDLIPGENTVIRIIDYQGRVVYTENFSAELGSEQQRTLNASHLASGFYQVVVSNKKQLLRTKLEILR